jgi:hypothetical protein
MEPQKKDEPNKQNEQEPQHSRTPFTVEFLR